MTYHFQLNFDVDGIRERRYLSAPAAAIPITVKQVWTAICRQHATAKFCGLTYFYAAA